MTILRILGVASLLSASLAHAAAAFGALPTVQDLRLSADGKSVSYISPTSGQGSVLHLMDLATGSKPTPPLTANGKPDRLGACNWVSSERLVCTVYGLVKANAELLPFTRMLAVDRTGKNPQLLSPWCSEAAGVWRGSDQAIDAAACGDELGKTAEASVRCRDRVLRALRRGAEDHRQHRGGAAHCEDTVAPGACSAAAVSERAAARGARAAAAA